MKMLMPDWNWSSVEMRASRGASWTVWGNSPGGGRRRSRGGGGRTRRWSGGWSRRGGVPGRRTRGCRSTGRRRCRRWPGRRTRPATPGGKLVFHVFAALAEFERDLVRERTSAGRGPRPRPTRRPAVGDDRTQAASCAADVRVQAVHGGGDREDPRGEPRLGLPARDQVGGWSSHRGRGGEPCRVKTSTALTRPAAMQWRPL
jgi:hypothetical protein